MEGVPEPVGGDLYSDIDNVRERITSENAMMDEVEARAQQSEQRAKKCKKEVAAYKLKIEQMRQRCTMLEKNLSCLFKTAWAHLHRKDMQIVDLKQQIKDFRKVTGMIAPGVTCDDVHMDCSMKDTTPAQAENRSPPNQAPQRTTDGKQSGDEKRNGASGRSRNSSAEHASAAAPARATQQIATTDARREASATEGTATPQRQQQHRQLHRSKEDDRRTQQARRDGSGRDVPHSRGGSPNPAGRHARGSRRDASPPPRPPRDRAARPSEPAAQRDDLRDSDDRDRERSCREREVRDRDSRDVLDSRELRECRGDLRRTQGSGKDRQRSGHARHRLQGARSRSRSPRG